MSARAPCERCGESIAVDARSCPDCGYEPANLRRVTALAILALPVFLVSVALLLAGFAPALAVGLPTVPSTTAEAFGLPGIVVSVAVLFAYARQDRRTPTDSTVF